MHIAPEAACRLLRTIVCHAGRASRAGPRYIHAAAAGNASCYVMSFKRASEGRAIPCRCRRARVRHHKRRVTATAEAGAAVCARLKIRRRVIAHNPSPRIINMDPNQMNKPEYRNPIVSEGSVRSRSPLTLLLFRFPGRIASSGSWGSGR